MALRRPRRLLHRRSEAIPPYQNDRGDWTYTAFQGEPGAPTDAVRDALGRPLGLPRTVLAVEALRAAVTQAGGASSSRTTRDVLDRADAYLAWLLEAGQRRESEAGR